MATTTENARFTQGVHKITFNDVTATKTGWAAWTGTPTRTTIATGSATATNCAEALMALIADLTAQGILAP
jgi:hypothetical protein